MTADRFEPLHRQPRRFVRMLALSVVAGGLVGLLMWLGDTRSELVPNVLFAAYVAAWIFLASCLLSGLAAPILCRVRAGRQPLAMGGLFFVAGILGWQLAAVTLPWLSAGHWHLGAVDWRYTIAFAGGIGALVGTILYLVERLRERLAESVIRIERQKYAERELETAREIQQRLLPPSRLAGDGWRLAARNLAAVVVAGDFYDVFTLADGTLGLAVGDVAGKGMGASLVMASVKGMLPLVAAERRPAAALEELNRRLAEQLPERQFVALCLAYFDPGSGELEIANAGLPDPYVLRDGAPPRPLTVAGTRLPLGLREHAAYAPLLDRLAPGERLVLLSDGLPEAPTPAGEPVGYLILEETLKDLPAPPEAGLDELFARLEARSRAPREDDWTALLLERSR